MSTLARLENRPFGDFFGWLELPLTVFRPLSSQTMRIEEAAGNDRCFIRAELPGADPEHDIEVTVHDGIVTIMAERHEDKHDGKGHSEFRYGSLTRRVRLPAGADEEHIQARYNRGILEVEVALKQPGAQARRIPVRLIQHIKPQ